MRTVVAEVIGGFVTSVTTLFGVTPKLTLLCGEWGLSFKKRWTVAECKGRRPKATCPHCRAINKVDIYI